MDKNLNILILEDSPKDAELLIKELGQGNFRFVTKRVETKEEYIKQIESFSPDLILSDNSLPAFNGFEALKIAKVKCSDIPFIFVSGIIGEQKVVELLKRGANDYVLKDRLFKINQAIQRSLNEAKEKRERKQAETELQQKNKELELFMYKASHNFKGPTATIAGIIDLARMEVKDKMAKQYFNLIENSINNLNETLSGLLNLTKVRQSEFSLSKINLNELIDEITARLKFLPGFDKFRIEKDIKLPGPIYSDRSLLSSVLQNLIENAFKYRKLKSDAYVKISVEQHSDIIVEVSDNGLGIEENLVPGVFDMFFRASQNSSGVGLGLYIVKHAIDKLKGAIKVNSTIGQGSVFTITLPNMQDKDLNGNLRKVKDSTTKVLILEDNPDDAELLKYELKSAGLTIQEKIVSEEKEFISALNEFVPDIILADYNLPSFGGMEALNIVIRKKLDIPLILVTGALGEEKAIETIKNGVTDFVLKDQLYRLSFVFNRALVEAKEKNERNKAKQLTKTKNEELELFMYRSSHNFKGPVASISGLINLADQEIKNGKALVYLSLIEETIGHLNATIDRLLDVTRVKQRALEPTEINFKEILKSNRQRIGELYTRDDVKIKLNLEGKNKYFSDSLMIFIILQNLVENAYLFRDYRRKSVVKINVSGSDYINITVSDNGLGINEEIRPYIFNMFYRGSEFSKSIGLGLYIVKSAVERLGGSISLNGFSVIGSKFNIKLPNLPLSG